MLGYDDVIAEQPQVREFADEGGSHTVITGEYGSADRWRPSELPPGRALETPEALFKRLDDVLEEEPVPSS
jgi:hypothetical protein